MYDDETTTPEEEMEPTTEGTEAPEEGIEEGTDDGEMAEGEMTTDEGVEE